MVLTRNVILSFFKVNIRLCPHQVAPPVKIMPRPFFHERGIACGTTCDKVPMAKMITVKDLIIISHSYCFFFNSKWRYVNWNIQILLTEIMFKMFPVRRRRMFETKFSSNFSAINQHQFPQAPINQVVLGSQGH